MFKKIRSATSTSKKSKKSRHSKMQKTKKPAANEAKNKRSRANEFLVEPAIELIDSKDDSKFDQDSYNPGASSIVSSSMIDSSESGFTSDCITESSQTSDLRSERLDEDTDEEESEYSLADSYDEEVADVHEQEVQLQAKTE